MEIFLNRAKVPENAEKISKDSFINKGEHLSESRTTPLVSKNERVENSVIIKVQELYNDDIIELLELDSEQKKIINSRIMKTLKFLAFEIDNSIEDSIVTFDTYTRQNVEITFKSRRDIILSISIDEQDVLPDSDIVNVEVAYLTYNRENCRYTINNSLEYILSELKKLL